MIIEALKKKLVGLGYANSFIEPKLKEFNMSILDNKNGTEDDIKASVYTKPNAYMLRFFLDTEQHLVSKFVFDGSVQLKTVMTSIETQMTVPDYELDKKLCIVGITEHLELEVVVYNPSRDVQNKYANKTYEEVFEKERDLIVTDYFSALSAGNRLNNVKTQEIIYTLMVEFVFDAIMLDNLNPKIKLYENASKFADAITNYDLKYINRKINKIETAQKVLKYKYLGAGVRLGLVSNDPYLKINEIKNAPDFYLNKPSYVWFEDNAKGQEEIAIYTANDSYIESAYSKLLENNDEKLLKISKDLAAKFSNQVEYQVSEEYVYDVISKLNIELIVPSINIIKMYSNGNTDNIEPLKYKFKLITDPSRFEELLYNSIEDNLGRKYRYRFVENIQDDLTNIGNKLNYTDITGNKVVKQSIADFNENMYAVIIKRETMIDVSSVQQLLGYMYEDVENTGTSLLPVPSIEVNFYFPDVAILNKGVKMYNGTSPENFDGQFSNSNIFYGIPSDDTIGQNVMSQDVDERSVIVRYSNSDGEVLKENIIAKQKINSIFVPEIIPVINDKQGKEWICDSSQNLSIRVSANDDENIIEVRYVPKLINVKINYINKHGVPIKSERIVKMQIGSIYNSKDDKILTDDENVDWTLQQVRPNKLVVSENEARNILTLVYDIKKAEVTINYLTKSGYHIKSSNVVLAQADKKYIAKIEERIVDSDNLKWMYLEESNPSVLVKEDEENVINLLYDAVREKVLIATVDSDKNKIKDDLVEFIQVGKKYSYTAKQSFIDVYGKWWELDSLEDYNIIVDENSDNNIITVKYKKALATVRIAFTDSNGKTVKDPIVKKSQIGAEYTSKTIGAIKDINGLWWKGINHDVILKVSADESKNFISYVYEPLMTNVTSKYISIEGNELLPSKTNVMQVGSKFVPEKIPILEGKDGRVWKISLNNVAEFVVKEYEQENIISINYEPKLTDVILNFKNVSGIPLKDEVHIKLQLGSEYTNYNEYYKIVSNSGEKWSVIKTEPAKMYVSENSKFNLIYDEIQARVLVKCVNIDDSKSIIDDVVITTKLGGVFAPNIQQKLIDRNRRKWKYIGDTGMSIITKENEQENIVILNYEPEKAKVRVEYLNDIGQKIRNDFEKEEQIGSDVAIKQLEYLKDCNELGWKLKNMTSTALKVDENPEKNKIVCTYEKQMTKVNVRYLDKNGNEIIRARTDNVQVGFEFKAEIIDKITDSNNKVWIYAGEQNNTLKICEEKNEVNLKYIPYKANVIQKYVDADGNTIKPEDIIALQVGGVFIAAKVEEIKDSEGKVWSYKKIENERIDISENADKNIITHVFDKKMIKVIVEYKTTNKIELRKHDEYSLQIGSKFEIDAPNKLRDKESMGWIITKNKMQVNISENENENVFEILYVEDMVNVYDRFITKENKEIIKPKVKKMQVGTKYIAEVEDRLVDELGAHWVQLGKSDIKIFASNYKVDPIIISENPDENNSYIKYKPELTDVIIKYQNTLGEIIKKEDVVQAQIGAEYTAEALDRIVGISGKKWMYNTNSKNTIIVSDKPNENTIFLTYEEQKASVTFRYQDECGTRLKKPNRKLVQIGTTYIPQFENIIEDEQHKVWEYKERDVEKLEVKDAEQDNIITLIYVPLKVDVTLKIFDKQGKTICDDIIAKAQLGSEFKPNINENVNDENSKMYKFVKANPEQILIRETPIGVSENVNVINLIYEEVYSKVTVKYQDFEGNLLKDDETIQLQVGEEYSAKPVQFIKDKRENQWELVNNKIETIRVRENAKDNIIKFVYEVAKADIVIKYKNVEGQKIREDEHFNQQVGVEFVPAIEKIVTGSDNRKWSFFNAEPIKLRVGSIGNLITLTYQEAQASVIIKYEDDSGRQIKESEKVLAQIGSRFKPKTTLKAIYEDNDIWRLDHFVPDEIIVSETADENVITQVFTNKKKAVIDIQQRNDTAENIDKVSEPETHHQNEIQHENNIQEENGNAEMDVLKDERFLKLEKIISLSDSEKETIQELSSYNSKIIELLHESVNTFLSGNEFDDKEIRGYVQKEKELIGKGLIKLIETDKIESKLYKVFQQVIVGDQNDVLFRNLQERKAILITDYFMNKPLSAIEQAMYIVERGKNDREQALIKERINDEKFRLKNLAELAETKSIILYENIMLDNYYKARSIPKDNYFKDNTSKLSLASDIGEAVNNVIIKQAFNLLQKNQSLNINQELELEALLYLLDREQIESLNKQLEKIYDSKIRKGAQKILKEFLKK